MRDDLRTSILTLVLFVALALCSHAAFLPLVFGFTGMGFVYTGGDVQVQLIPALSFLERAIMEGNLLWSFEYGLGGDLFNQFSYYYTTSPFFYLQFAIKRLLGVAGASFAVTAMWRLFFSIVKQVLCMCFMYLLVRREGHRWVSSACAAVLYGCSFWYIDNSFAFDFMTDAMLWPPLLMLALGRYRRGGSWVPLCIVVALMLANSCYFGYINAVFCVIVALIFSWVGGEGSLGARIGGYLWRLVKLGLVFVLGLALACVAFYPAATALLGADRAQVGTTFSWLPSFEFLALLPEVLFAKAGAYTADAAQNYGLPLMVLLAFMVRYRDVDELGRKKTLLALVMVVFAIVPVFSSLMNGLSYPSNRWCYLVVFAIAYALPVWMEALVVQKRNLIPAIVVIAVLCVVFYLTHDARVADFAKLSGHSFWAACNSDIVMLAVEVATMVALIFSRTESVPAYEGGHVVSRPSAKISPLVTVGFVAAVVIAMPYGPYTFHSKFVNNENAEQFSSAEALGGLYPGAEESILPYSSMNLETEGFYRFIDEQAAEFPIIDDRERRYENRTWLLGGYGVNLYNSLIPKTLSQGLKMEYGISPLSNTASQYRGFGHRLMLETAWGVERKFNVDEHSNTYGYDKHGSIYKTHNITGIDLWYPQYVIESTADGWTYGQRDCAILQAATIEDGAQVSADVPEKEPSFDTMLTFDVTLDNVSFENCSYEDGVLYAERGAAVEITPRHPDFDRDDVGEYLLTFTATERNGNAFVFTAAGENYWTGKADYQWGYPRHEYTICYTGNPSTLRVEIDPGEYDVSGVSLEYNSYRRFERWADDVDRFNLEGLVIGKNTLSGTIAPDTAGVLALSVPYDKGWSCTVDGTPVNVMRANECMLGIELSAGSHDVVFTYRNYELETGLRITLAAAVLLVIAGVGTWMLGRRRTA